MPTPTFTFRLAASSQQDLAELAKLMQTRPRPLARAMLEAMLSGNPDQVKGLLRRLSMAAGEQLALNLNAVVDQVTRPQQPAKKALVHRKGGRTPP
jgi:hypothetical protein